MALARPGQDGRQALRRKPFPDQHLAGPPKVCANELQSLKSSLN
jgi:hypothetical protein